MEQLATVLFLLGIMFLAEKTKQPLLNIIASGFAFYLAFTVTAPALMVILIVLGLFELVYMYQKIK